jgi:polysaccharide deacetylase 2 family uncharacterized protein YibQ
MKLRGGALLLWILLPQIATAQAAETAVAVPAAATAIPATATSAIPTVTSTAIPAVTSTVDSTASTASSTVDSAVTATPGGRIALIIDDLGYSLRQGRRSIGLPGAVTCSILPGAPHAQQLAQQAKDAGKEIMLHLPMHGSAHRIEPDSLSGEMTEADFRGILRRQLAAIPAAVGVNNHMGSSVTPLPEQMNWLMDELAARALYFVDSRTTHLTVSADAARSHNVAFTERDVFLDNDQDPAAIEKAFQQLIRKAKKRGQAIGIAHARRSTLVVLEQLLPTLAAEGIILEPVSKLLPQKTVPVENLTAQNQDIVTTSMPSAQ